jgi:hypothetical protein
MIQWNRTFGPLISLQQYKSYNKYVAIYTKQEIFKGIQEEKKLHTTYKEVIIFGKLSFWVLVTFDSI